MPPGDRHAAQPGSGGARAGGRRPEHGVGFGLQELTCSLSGGLTLLMEGWREVGDRIAFKSTQVAVSVPHGNNRCRPPRHCWRRPWRSRNWRLIPPEVVFHIGPANIFSWLRPSKVSAIRRPNVLFSARKSCRFQLLRSVARHRPRLIEGFRRALQPLGAGLHMPDQISWHPGNVFALNPRLNR